MLSFFADTKALNWVEIAPIRTEEDRVYVLYVCSFSKSGLGARSDNVRQQGFYFEIPGR